MTKNETAYLTPTIDKVSKLSRPWAKVASFGNVVEDAPRPVATLERSSIPAPFDLDALLLQSEEYHEGGDSDSARECGGSNTKTERELAKPNKTRGGGSTH